MPFRLPINDVIWPHSINQAGGEMPHPLDLNYELLKTDLALVDNKSSEFSIIEKYLRSTEPMYRKLEILDVWRVDRQGVVIEPSACCLIVLLF